MEWKSWIISFVKLQARCKLEIKQRGSFFLALLEKGSNTWETKKNYEEVFSRKINLRASQEKPKIIVFNLCTWNTERKKKRGRVSRSWWHASFSAWSWQSVRPTNPLHKLFAAAKPNDYRRIMLMLMLQSLKRWIITAWGIYIKSIHFIFKIMITFWYFTNKKKFVQLYSTIFGKRSTKVS